MKNKQYIFGYGSLVSPTSVHRTLGRTVDMVYPVTLNGWIRDWSITLDKSQQSSFFQIIDSGEVPRYVASLNVRKSKKNEKPSNPVGVIFEVTEDEFRSIDVREIHYKREDVTKYVIGAPKNSTIYTYVGKEKYMRQFPGTITPKSYANLVEKGFSDLGTGMYFAYTSTTIPSPHPEKNTVFVSPHDLAVHQPMTLAK